MRHDCPSFETANDSQCAASQHASAQPVTVLTSRYSTPSRSSLAGNPAQVPATGSGTTGIYVGADSQAARVSPDPEPVGEGLGVAVGRLLDRLLGRSG